MRNVLFFIESLGCGGAEKVLLDIVKNIDKKRYNITIMTVVDTGVYAEEIKEYCNYKSILPDINNINCKFKKILYKIKYKLIYIIPCKFLYKMLVHDKYDTEVGFIEGYATKFIASSNNNCSKKIAWVHVDPIGRPYSDNYYKNLDEQRNYYFKYNYIICVSNSVKEKFKEKFNIKNNVLVKYNPINSIDIIESSKEEVDMPYDKLKLVTVGRLTNQKGYDRLLKAIKLLKEEKYKFKLFILGEGEEFENLSNYIKNNKLSDCVQLCGFCKNPYKYIRKADIFICSSRAEGFSLAIAEAIILEKAIISTKCSGPNELLGFGNYGMLVDNSVDGLYKGIKDMIDDKKNIELYKNKSRKRKKIFNINKSIKEIEKLL